MYKTFEPSSSSGAVYHQAGQGIDDIREPEDAKVYFGTLYVGIFTLLLLDDV